MRNLEATDTAEAARLSWRRFGRLYGSEANWTAEFDGQKWCVAPTHVCAAEEAAFNY